MLRSGSDGAFKRLLAAADTGQLRLKRALKRFCRRYDSHIHVGLVNFDVVAVLIFRFVNIEATEEGCDDEPQLHGFQRKIVDVEAKVLLLGMRTYSGACNELSNTNPIV